jgi:hypothetical protein
LSKKARRLLNRINLAARLMRQGLPIGDAARRANVSEEQVRRALGVAKKQLSEGEHMTEHRRKLGATGLSYGTPAAQEMIQHRMRKLAESGYCTEGEARSVAVGQLAQEGNLKTKETVSGEKRYLGEVRQAGPSAEDKQAQGFLAAAKAEASERGVPLSTVMNEKVMKGQVKL